MDEAPPTSEGTPAAADAAQRRYPIEFTGTGSEYFRIWIVNLLLTIVTLGIYSAWAKVRRLQYFYRNTRLDGSVFDYHGRPGAILRGRLIAVIAIAGYRYAFDFSPWLGMAAALGFVGLLPWLLAQSQRFRLHNSNYRGLRFRFLGSTAEAYRLVVPPIVLMLLPGVFVGFAAGQVRPDPMLFVPVAAGYLLLLALAPYLHYRAKRYQHANTAYGGEQSTFDGRPGAFYRLYLEAVAMGLGAVLVAVVLVAFAGMAGVALGGRGAGGVMAGVVVLVLFYAALIAAMQTVVARVQNYVWQRTTIGPVRFDSQVKPGRLAGVVLGNLVLIVLTLGLFIPFAAIRLLKVKLESVSVISAGDLDRIAQAGAGPEIGAVGEGAVDLLDIDFAL